jgi:hypothetical protein
MIKALCYIVLILLNTFFIACETGIQRISNNQKNTTLNQKCIAEFFIDKDTKLCYLSNSVLFAEDIYERPRILHKNDLIPVKGIDEATGTGFMSISPHKKYLMLYKIEVSCLNEECTKVFEKWSQLIVDIQQRKVVEYLSENQCEGFWSRQDEWISIVDSSVIFP